MSAVHFDEFFGYPQTKNKVFSAGMELFFDQVRATDNSVYLVTFDRLTFVLYFYCKLIIDIFDSHADMTVHGRELYRSVEKIDQHLCHPVIIGVDNKFTRGRQIFQFDVLFSREWQEGLYNL